MMYRIFRACFAFTKTDLLSSHPNVIRLPAPDTHGIGIYDFSQSDRLADEGHQLVSAFLAERPELTRQPSYSAA